MLGSRWPFGSTPDKDLGPSCRQVMHLGESLLQIIQKKLKARKIQKVFSSSSSKLQLVRMLWTIKEWQWHIQMCWQFLKHPGNVGAETKATSCMLLSLIICVLQQHLKKRQLAVVFFAMLELIESIWILWCDYCFAYSKFLCAAAAVQHVVVKHKWNCLSSHRFWLACQRHHFNMIIKSFLFLRSELGGHSTTVISTWC